ncbi:MAG: hypothetical protein JJE10_02430 [Thermoleophilia bacterium]|nr:hypothetical protein [Thermoleophilia bacterium]
MRSTALVTLFIAAASLALPATSFAGLPQPKNAMIKVPKKLGGVKTGMKIKDANKAWGKRGDCNFKGSFRQCSYQSKNLEKGSAVIASNKKSGRVSEASIYAGLKGGNYNFKGPLMRFETKQGLGLGDKGSKIRKLYPKAKSYGNNTGYYVRGKGKTRMTLETADGKRITAIRITDGTQG